MLLSSILISCIRDDKCYPYREEVKLPIYIDWEGTTNIPEYLKFIYFSTDSDWVFTRYPEHTNKDTLEIPYGNYRVLLYNWRSNGDIQYIKFEQENSFENSKVRTDFKKSRLFSEEILFQPDSFFTWSSGEEIIPVFNNEGETTTRSNQALIIKPIQMVNFYDFFIPATGVQYVKKAEAVLSGVARYKLLHNQQTTGDPYLMSVDMHPQTDGIRFVFSAFGFIKNVPNILTIRLVLLDDTSLDFSYDLTQEILSGKITGPFDIINIPYAKGDNSFGDPNIGDWQEVSENIPF